MGCHRTHLRFLCEEEEFLLRIAVLKFARGLRHVGAVARRRGGHEVFFLRDEVRRLVIEALLRRAGRTQQAASTVLQVADLTLDMDSHDVRRGGEEITLTNTEFELLRYLMENVGIVLSKQKILDAVWSYDFGGQVNVVELYISYLRKKIDADRPALIRTVRGAGYIMREPQ